MPEPMTSQAYVKKGGGVCPLCQGNQIEGGYIEVDGSGASQEVSCQDCQAEWMDYYRLVSYEVTREPAPGKDEPDQ